MIIGKRYKLIKYFLPKIYLKLQAEKPYHQDDLFTVLSEVCDSNSSAIDIGTNHGIYSYWISRYSKEVYSFEPNPILAAELIRTLPGNCKLIEKGLSNKNMELILNIPKDDGLASFEKNNVNIIKNTNEEMNEVKVPVCRLDEFNFSNIRFIKIDVEGHEIEVLEGALETISNNLPRVFIEIKNENREQADSMIFSYFEKLNYNSYFIVDGKLKRFNRNDLSSNYFLKGGNVLMIHNSDELSKKVLI